MSGKDNGIVPDRRSYDIPNVGQREMRGPYDLTIRIRRQLQTLIEQKDSILNGSTDITTLDLDNVEALEDITCEIVQLVFVEPFDEDQLLDIPYLSMQGYIEDFLADLEKSGESAKQRAVAQDAKRQRKQRTSRSSPRSKATTKGQTP